MMSIPYDDIIAVKVLYNNIKPVGILNRLRKFIYKKEMERIKKVLVRSIDLTTYIFKEDIVQYCKFVNAVYHQSKHKWVSVITYGDGDYQIKMNYFFGYYTLIDISRSGPLFRITSNDPHSSILIRDTTMINTKNSDIEKKIYEVMIYCIVDYLI